MAKLVMKYLLILEILNETVKWMESIILLIRVLQTMKY